MKGGYHGVRVKQVSLIIIALVCVTIVMWACDKTSLLTAFLPPQFSILKPSPDIIMGAPLTRSPHSKPDVQVKKDIGNADPDREESKEEEKKGFGDSGAGNTTDISETKLTVLQTDPKENVETSVEPAAKSSDLETPMNSEPNTVPKAEDDEILKMELQVNKENPDRSSEQQKESEQSPHKETETQQVHKTSDSGMQVTSENSASFETEKQKNSTIDLTGKKGCNYAKGKWFEDKTRPLYSGFGCKQWLSGMWACRLTQRTDFAYESFRWRPKDCSMPEFKESSFLTRRWNGDLKSK